MTPDPDAKRRALQLLVSQVGGPPVVGLQPEPLASFAPDLAPEYQEGTASTLPPPETPEETEARLRSEEDRRIRIADLGALGSRFIEGTTGAKGADIWSPMRERAGEPLKAFLALQKEKAGAAPRAPTPGRVVLSNDPASAESKRAQARVRANFPDVTDEELANVTEASEERFSISRGGKSSRAIQEKGITATNERERLRREQQGRIWADQRGIKWAEMDLDERELAERIAAREAAAIAKKEEQVAGATERLGGELEKTGAAKFYAQYDEAQEIIKKYKSDLPGLGRVDGRLPDEALSPDGRQMRFLVGQLLSEYRKGQTGAGMSDSERAEYAQITGLLYSGSDSAVKQGLDTLKRALDARVEAIKGGFRPEAVKTYEERVPSMRGSPATGTPKRVPPSKGLPTGPDGNPTLDSPPPRRRRRDKQGQLWEEQPDGSAKRVPG